MQQNPNVLGHFRIVFTQKTQDMRRRIQRAGDIVSVDWSLHKHYLLFKLSIQTMDNFKYQIKLCKRLPVIIEHKKECRIFQNKQLNATKQQDF